MNKKQFWIRFGVMCAVIAVILTLDLVTKYVFEAKLTETITIIPGLFNFTQVFYNRGAAWGMLEGKQVFLIGLTIVFLAIFIAYYIKEKNKTWLLNITFGFLIGGSLGNLYDRIVLGGVRDFIQFDFWKSFPLFNFADACLCIGVVLFIVYLIIYFVTTSKKNKISVQKPENDKEENNEKDV